MKNLFNFFMSACIIMLAACSQNIEDSVLDDEITTVGERITIGVDMQGEEDTRVSLNNLELLWQTGDVLTAIGRDSGGQYIGTSDFTLISGDNTKNAVFSGNTIPGAASYSFVYRSAKLKVNADGTYVIDYTGLTQSAVGDQSHVRDCLLISADNVLKENLKNSIKMNLKTSFLMVDVKSIPKDTKAFDEIQCYVNYGNKDGKQKLLASVKTLGSITPGSSNLIYLPFNNGASLEAGSVIAVKFIIKTKALTVIGTSKNGKQYLDGKRYKLTVSVDKNDTKALNNWLLPANNMIWVKTPDGKAPQSKIELPKGGFLKPQKIVTLTSNQPNVDGWYEYKTENDITDIGTALQTIPFKEVWLPSTLTSIAWSAFNGQQSLSNIILPDNIKEIGGFAFSKCKSLKEITIPSGVTSIGTCFIEATNITKINILCPIIKTTVKDIFGRYNNSEQCELVLHQSWKEYILSNGEWNGTLFDKKFEKISYVDDNGHPVNL